MFETMRRITKMALYGVEDIGLCEKRDYRSHIPENPRRAAEERWEAIGSRLRNSMDKVVGECDKA